MKIPKFHLDSLWQNNTFFKVISVVIACIIWVVVAMNMKTDIPREIKEVPVTMDNQTSFITRMGLTIIGDESLFVDVTIEGQRLVVGSIKPEDIAVSVDLSSVNGAGNFSLPLVAENVSGKDFAISSISPSTVNLKFDRMVTKKFNVDVKMEGLVVPEEGYLMEEAVVSPTQVSVTGPDTDIAKIAKCVVSVDHEGSLTKTTAFTSDIVLLDKDGNKIETSGLTMDVKQAEVTVPILKTVDLPVKVEFLNAPTNLDLEELEYAVSNETVTVAGPVDEIDKYSEIILGYIDFKALDLESNFTFDVELPENFINVAHTETVTVTFDWTDMVAKEFTVTNLSLVNVPSDYDARLLTDRVTKVKIIGPAQVLETMTADDLVGQIDLSKRSVETGQFKTAVTISAPSKNLVWAVGDYTAVVVISEKD
ncbi:MAG: CdaR family protein [Oscillospiraceae bacterium]|jgi:YbbR domain-containing protein|nr:CdaR family protein [Oscillospiraceae bacterium]MDD7041250.1 CdaR family protein [Oscillospiraceae bacterium]MDY2611553.1 CdaR family protein [Oscillospiraceae bacterium]